MPTAISVMRLPISEKLCVTNMMEKVVRRLIGEHEKVYSAEKAVKRLNRVAPQIKTEVTSRAGHDLWMIQAKRVKSEILNFLGEREK